jgi:branched-chain amino acid transport system ATP-binding protein
VEGITILVVEQNAHRALELATRGYVIEMGTIVMAGDAEQLRHDPGVQRAYLGADPDELLAGVPGSG